MWVIQYQTDLYRKTVVVLFILLLAGVDKGVPTFVIGISAKEKTF